MVGEVADGLFDSAAGSGIECLQVLSRLSGEALGSLIFAEHILEGPELSGLGFLQPLLKCFDRFGV